MAKKRSDIHLLTTEAPPQGRSVVSSWMIWGAEAPTVNAAVESLQTTAARHSADAVIAVRIVSQSRRDVRFLATHDYEPTFTAYGTAVVYG